MSLFYVAGMYYNDACDADYDTKHQPYRPIPSGQISRLSVQLYALSYSIVAFLLICTTAVIAAAENNRSSFGWLVSSSLLVVCIVLYNHYHKNNPLSPFIMAGCRIAVLATSSYALTARLPTMVQIAMVAMLCWLSGLTYLAKQEQRIEQSDSFSAPKAPSGKNGLTNWPLLLLSIPVFIGLILSFKTPVAIVPTLLLAMVTAIANRRILYGSADKKGSAIALMIAGICLLDGIFIAHSWGLPGVVVSACACATTLFLQRWVAGT